MAFLISGLQIFALLIGLYLHSIGRFLDVQPWALMNRYLFSVTEMDEAGSYAATMLRCRPSGSGLH